MNASQARQLTNKAISDSEADFIHLRVRMERDRILKLVKEIAAMGTDGLDLENFAPSDPMDLTAYWMAVTLLTKPVYGYRQSMGKLRWNQVESRG